MLRYKTKTRPGLVALYNIRPGNGARANIAIYSNSELCYWTQRRLQWSCSVPTWRQTPVETRQPKLVLTTLGDRPRAEKSFEKDMVSCMRGRSSAITHRIRTLDRFMPRAFSADIEVPRPRVHSSITPYEQNVSRTDRTHHNIWAWQRVTVVNI